MTIHFAAATPSIRRAPLARMLAARIPLAACNDNAAETARDPLIRAALQLFAKHGLGAAGQAAENAMATHHEGDGEGCRRWLAICGKLDRPLAARTVRQLGIGD